MSDTIDAIVKEVEKFNDSIVQALDSKNISNTREAARSIREEHGKDFVRSIGIFYLEFLDTGRAPGSFPPITPLENWARTKFGVDEKEATSIAFAVATKIKNLGTEIFLNNSRGIELDKKIVTLRENIADVSLDETVKSIKQGLDRFKKMHLKNKYQI